MLHCFVFFPLEVEVGLCQYRFALHMYEARLFFPPQESLRFAFDAAKVYSHTFERFRLFYKENESLDLDALRQQEHGNVLYISIKTATFRIVLSKSLFFLLIRKDAFVRRCTRIIKIVLGDNTEGLGART